ncbi:hypothetical protein GJ496_003751 [Pomphorhynchus laevis]|nr:hypothetical protein GJ496_003751 [Pomphorhynchus laevis]
MGNKLVSTAPKFVFPIEFYQSMFGSDLSLLHSLCSTRLCKVALLTNSECDVLCLVKLFPIYDVSLPYADMINKLQDQQNQLEDSNCCIFYSRIVLNNKAVCLIRTYTKTTLFERLTVKPYLSKIEKYWITYQLFKALEKCHDSGVYHGDLKLENILLTSWNKVFLTDFAGYKPTWLPSEDPSVYYYFFVSDQRDCCTVAPERFINFMDIDEGIMDTFSKSGQMKMDIFSLGCILYELHAECSLFKLSELLKYRSNGQPIHHDKIKETIDCPILAQLIINMTDLDHSKRPSMKECFKIPFPDSFDSFLFDYINSFCSSQLTCELMVQRIYSDWNSHLRDLLDDTSTSILTSLLLSCARSLQFTKTKILLIELLKNMCIRLEALFVQDRILPYCIHFLSDREDSIVRIYALELLITCLDVMNTDTFHICPIGLFTDYLLQQLDITNKKSFHISRYERAFFTKLPSVLSLSLKLLQHHKDNSVVEGTQVETWFQNQLLCCIHHDKNYELTVLCLNSSLECLQAPFSTRKTFLFVLSHLATIPNKFTEDWRSRMDFFNCATTLCPYYGGPIASTFLQTFLYHGIMDDNAAVVDIALRLLERCLSQSIFNKKEALRYLSVAMVHQSHPSCNIRDNIQNIINRCRKCFSFADFIVYINPLIKKLSYRLVEISSWQEFACSQWKLMNDQLINDTINSVKQQDDAIIPVEPIKYISIDSKFIEAIEDQNLPKSGIDQGQIMTSENNRHLRHKEVTGEVANSLQNLAPYMELVFTSGDHQQSPLLKVCTNNGGTLLTLDKDSVVKQWNLSQIEHKIIFKSSKRYNPFVFNNVYDIDFNDSSNFTMAIASPNFEQSNVLMTVNLLQEGILKHTSFPSDYGYPVQLICSNSTIYLITAKSYLLTFDIRSSHQTLQSIIRLPPENVDVKSCAHLPTADALIISLFIADVAWKSNGM